MGSNQPESPSIPSVDESAARMAVDIRRFRWMSRLACDYAYNFDAVAPFFAWRALVLASPIWYPHITPADRERILAFAERALAAERFDPAWGAEAMA